ncbi:MAG: tetratricopeptide repeat protein, partial [Candidatus Hydrogenedens sp.]|nr:tetratricopeptide repeat protein [Candidatus Hydrogenedens sp.]
VLLRRRWETWPLAAFALVYTFYYVYLVPIVFTWYKMPHVAAILLLASLGVQAVTNRLHDPVRWRIRTGFSLAYVSLFAGVLPWTFLTERQIQRDIEEPVRKAAGLYLRDRMKPDEAVGGEPLGYMGYYSRGNVYDWPGLNSRRVVEWSRENPGRRSLQQMLEGLQPEYLFLRDMEMLYVFQLPAWIRNNYHPVAAFQVDREKARRIRWLETSMDVEYRIYKKNRPDDPKPYDESLWPAAPPVNFLEADKIYAVGASYTHRGMLRQAIAHYERAVELEPGHTNAWHDLAVVYLRDGQHARARAAAEESIRRGAKPDPVLMDALK